MTGTKGPVRSVWAVLESVGSGPVTKSGVITRICEWSPKEPMMIIAVRGVRKKTRNRTPNSPSFWELLESSHPEVSRLDDDPGSQCELNVLVLFEGPSAVDVFQASKCAEIVRGDVWGIR